jgi:hypothetical protein
MPKLYATVTNHGFGHATRMASVLAVLQSQAPELEIIVASTTPQWLLAEYLPLPFSYRSRSFDVGVVQSDSLAMDKEQTLQKWQEIRSQQSDIIAEEAQFLLQQKVDLVLADIPHLAVAIAHQAGIPCWMMSNFGWDFIYRDWGGKFHAVADWLSDSYAQCDRLFRLPFCEAMSSFPVIQDVGLTGVPCNFSPADLYSKLQLSADRFTVLLTFGGLSLQEIPYNNILQFPDWQFITFDQNAPNLPNLKIIDRRWQIRPLDIMQICDRIVTKPGYGTLAETYRTGRPVICLRRNDFAEADVLLAGVEQYMQHLVIEPDDFLHGDWQFLHEPLRSPSSNHRLSCDGEYTIAGAILTYFAYASP